MHEVLIGLELYFCLCFQLYDFDQGVCYLFGIQYWCETAGFGLEPATSKSRGGAVKLF